ncbi:hypothetical protein GCM10022408_18330 [Hymenobacter fastidiosus]|uniref:Gliding motility-associated protein GldM N-terminal domain-containing protein n=1 Tax=Hymenobacter fastidiosus TaxID=486264 RepID=A0ABP7S545_9BACT
MVGCHSGPDPRLLRLKLLADTQQHSNDRALQEAERMVQGLKWSVARNHQPARDVAVLDEGREILRRTKALSERLRRMRAAMLESLGGEYAPYDLNSRPAVTAALLTPGTALYADSLYEELRSFTTFMQPLAPGVEVTLWQLPGGMSDPILPSTPAGYRQFYFQDTPAAEVLAVLAQQEAEVLRLALAALTVQTQKIGSIDLIFFRFGAQAVPKSDTVRAGGIYAADLLLVQGYRLDRSLRMTANGDSILVDSDGRGQVRFRVPSELPPGRSRVQAHWDGAIRARVRGEDTTFRVRVPYTIVR